MAKAPQAPTGLQQGDAAHIWRWIPSKTRRAQGWKALTLKDPDTGKHLSLPDAWRACDHINALVEAAERGDNLTGLPWAHVAPLSVRRAPEIASGRSLGTLLDSYCGAYDPATLTWGPGCDEFRAKSPDTQKDERLRLKRLFEVLAGLHSGEPARKGLPRRTYTRALTRYRHWMAQVRALPIDAIIVHPKTPEELADEAKRGIVPPPSNLERAYAFLAKQVNEATGKPQLTNAAAIMRYTRLWLEWVRKRLRANWTNPVEFVDVQSVDGRIVIWEDEEIEQLLAACRKSGWYSVAFAVELALELSWSQRDILNLKWHQIKDGRVLGTRSKTGVKTETTLTDNGLDIVRRIRAHYGASEDGKVTFLPTDYVIRVDKREGHRDYGAPGKGWYQKYFQQIFIACRNSVEWTWNITKTFQDFRDTAITMMWEAGLDFPEIASRTQHTLAHIQAVIEKHYGAITRTISDNAAAKLNTHRKRRSQARHL
ncbi:MAG: hypothetical protein QM667_13350 [Asticcacaulis sp.]